MADRQGTWPHFRLNFEQQQKRAKDLLKAARGGDAAALARFKSSPKLSEAQFLIARELRFDDWAHLKRHIAAMAREREAMKARRIPGSTASATIDGELRTLHVRCGSDIQASLREAGFGGDFYEHSYPYLFGPVREGRGVSSNAQGFSRMLSATRTFRRSSTEACSTACYATSSACTIPRTTSA